MKTAKAWCMENYINNKAMNMAYSTAQEIETHLKRNASHLWKKENQNRQASDEEIQQLIAQAFVLNVAYKVNKNYVALRADVMTYVHPGSVFFREKEPPQVIAYQNILRTSKTFAMQITPIDMEWIRQENGALHALYEEKASQVNICEVRIDPVSRGILRYILGPANRHVDALNQELDALVHGDYDKDALVAWCKPSAANFVFSELTRRVESRKMDLELEMREDSIVGETRIVWGCGGEAKLLLFQGDYIGINIRNVPCSWALPDVDLTVRNKFSQPIKDSIRDLFFLPKDLKSRTARIVFDDPVKAATAFQELSSGGLRELEFCPALSNRPSVYKETEAWLTISFAIAPSQKSAIIIYDNMEDANYTITSRCLGFRPSRSKPKDNIASSEYHSSVVNGLFVKNLNPFGIRVQYVLYANRIPADWDEEDVKNRLHGCPVPNYIKIIRGSEMKFEKLGNGTNETDLLLNYAKANELLPFPEKIFRTFVGVEKKQKKVNIRARYESSEQIEMIHVSRLCRSLHHDQPVRLKAKIKTSVRIEKNLWGFRQQPIQTYLKTLKTKEIEFKLETKPITHVWIHLEVLNMENIDEIRKKIDHFLQFRFYKNSKIELLFTHYGHKQLCALDANPGYVHFNFATKAVRVYGEEAERKIVIEKLNNLVETLANLCVDVPLILRKTSVATVEKNLSKYRNGGLSDELRLSYNRLYATGTKEGIEILKNALKDYIIQPRNEIGRGDCGVCFSPIEDPIFLQLCAHKFCSECIKAMVNQQPVPYPIICPADGCGTKLCLKDIQEIAPISSLEKIGQSAINALLLQSKNKYRNCFKTGCEQYNPIRDKKLEEKEQVRCGGDVVSCDQCNLHYCATCSITLKKPVERHRGMSCAFRQVTENRDVRLHRLHILDEICMLRCPRCRAAFHDFEGCCALTCGFESCKAAFCFFCLQDCGRDAHSHVKDCPKNPSRGTYFIDASKKNVVHKESRKGAIVQYLMKTCNDRGMRSSVLHSIEKDLKDLGIIINPSEVNLVGYTPVAESAKHGQHILNEICTTKCPKCRAAFFDFEGCSALQCWNCKTQFCFFCLQDCDRDEQKAFAHVIKCQKNPVPGQLHTSPNDIAMVNIKRRKDGIIQYLLTHCQDVTERQAVIDSVSINLKELNIVIGREDLNPISRVPPPIPVVEPRIPAPSPVRERRGVPVGHPLGHRIPPAPPQRQANGMPNQRQNDNCVFL